MINLLDKDRFLTAKFNVVTANRGENGIGTLSEKTPHAVLKEYFCPDTSCHEVKIGRMVADIFTGEEIIEIQTKSFDKMRRKLENFLPKHPVTIVHPVPHIKTISWINPETGATSKPRRSTITGNVYMVFTELYRIKNFLKDPNLSICIVLLDMEEYKLLDGWSRDKKRGCTKLDKIPTNLVSQTTLSNITDYKKLVPSTLNSGFSVKDFAKEAKISVDIARITLNVMLEIGVVARIGKKGNAFLYDVCKNHSELL